MKHFLFTILFLIVSAAVCFAQLNIQIDAEKDEWYNTLTGPDDGYLYIPHYANEGASQPDGDEDLSALCWFGWDETYLYCYTEIQDDIILVNNSTYWENDQIELKMDPDPDALSTSGVAAARMTALGEDEADEPAGVDNISSGGELDESFEPVEGEDYARKVVETDDYYGYTLEFRIPWDAIVSGTKYVNVGVGGIWGLGIAIGDNDETSRTEVLMWAAAMNGGIWNNPRLHGTVTFLEDGKLQFTAINSAGGDAEHDSTHWYIPPNTAVASKDRNVTSFGLEQNYPNPFNPKTTISYQLPTLSKVDLSIHNLRGQKIATLVSKTQQTGVYATEWDASGFESGVYFYQLKTDQGLVQTRKLTLIR